MLRDFPVNLEASIPLFLAVDGVLMGGVAVIGGVIVVDEALLTDAVVVAATVVVGDTMEDVAANCVRCVDIPILGETTGLLDDSLACAVESLLKLSLMPFLTMTLLLIDPLLDVKLFEDVTSDFSAVDSLFIVGLVGLIDPVPSRFPSFGCFFSSDDSFEEVSFLESFFSDPCSSLRLSLELLRDNLSMAVTF